MTFIYLPDLHVVLTKGLTTTCTHIELTPQQAALFNDAAGSKDYPAAPMVLKDGVRREAVHLVRGEQTGFKLIRFRNIQLAFPLGTSLVPASAAVLPPG